MRFTLISLFGLIIGPITMIGSAILYIKEDRLIYVLAGILGLLVLTSSILFESNSREE